MKPNKKKTGRPSISLQESLVTQYFDELDWSRSSFSEEHTEFDRESVLEKINLAIDSGTSRERSRPYRQIITWLVAASLFAGFTFSAWVYRYTLLDRFNPLVIREIIAANGELKKVVLEDGTAVWLNGGSKLSYPESFRGNKREVSLTGEAFLDVAHDPLHPFIVHTGNITTQVLGTSFNIRARGENQLVQIDVLSGKVGIMGTGTVKGRQGVIFLTAGQELRYNKRSHEIIKNEHAELAGITGWKEGQLVFKNIALPEVITTLEHRFNIHILSGKNLAACYISADFTHVPLSNILKILSRLVKGSAVETKDGYMLTGKGCSR